MGIPVAEVQPTSVLPQARNAFGDESYEITAQARGEYQRYVVLVGPNQDLSEPTRLLGPPSPSENDLLRAAPGTWEATDIRFAVSPSGRRAFIVTSAGALASVELRSGVVRYRALGGRAPGRLERAIPLGEDRIAFSGERELVIAGTRSPELRRVRRGRECQLARGAAFFVVYGFGCPGVTVYALNGGLIRRVLARQRVNELALAGRYGYARSFEQEETTQIVDLRTGRTLGSVPARSLLIAP